MKYYACESSSLIGKKLFDWVTLFRRIGKQMFLLFDIVEDMTLHLWYSLAGELCQNKGQMDEKNMFINIFLIFVDKEKMQLFDNCLTTRCTDELLHICQNMVYMNENENICKNYFEYLRTYWREGICKCLTTVWQQGAHRWTLLKPAASWQQALPIKYIHLFEIL